MKYILEKLNESYPDSSDFKSFAKEALVISGFVFAFLYFFQPYGLGGLKEGKLLVCLGFGAITFAVCIMYESIQTFVFKVEKDLPSWTLGKWLIHTMVMICLIAMANHLFQMWLMSGKLFRPHMLMYSFLSTLGIGIFPVVFAGLYNQVRYLNKHVKEANTIRLEEAKEIKTEDQLLTLPNSNKKQDLRVNQSQLIYLEAMQNYVLVYYKEDEALKKEILRSTLSQVESLLPEEHFFRCHRSFLVNLNHILYLEGNAQGLKLFVHEEPQLNVPVSRKNIQKLKNHLSQKGVIRP